ncbi:MAG: hypothetical protein HZB92_09370 [Euryarchaeota archaeon]|nr:hypothetical protein [Euryarchaeota archaeon]
MKAPRAARAGKAALFAAAATALLVLTIVPAGVRGAWGSLEIVPSRYTQSNVYVPGEMMEIVLRAGPGETYDVIVAAGSVGGQNLALLDTIVIGSGGSTKVTYTVPVSMPDGNYTVEVLLDHTNPGTLQEARLFRVQGYSFEIETDMQAYLGGDPVTVFWTANNLKDGSLAPSGVGKIFVRNSAGDIVAQSDFASPAGSYTFNLSVLANTSLDYWVDGWFNDSATKPERVQNATKGFQVGQLGVITSLDRESYSAEGLVNTTVRTVVTDNQDSPNATDQPEKGCTVDIRLYRLDYGSYALMAEYNATLSTDSMGYARHILQLPRNLPVGTEMRMTATAKKGSHSWSDSEVFTIADMSSLSVVLAFDRSDYTSGQTIRVNTSVSQIGAAAGSVYTYVYEARDSQTGVLVFRGTNTAGTANLTLSSDYEGTIRFKVTVDDGKGNKASAERALTILYARVFVNADVQYYEAGDTVRVTYQIVGKFQSPEVFYEVLDAEGAKVVEGNATGGAFSFTVPQAPSSRYEIRAIATQGGRLTVGSTTIQQSLGVSIALTFNRPAYAPGDTMFIRYRITSMTDSPLPPSLVLSYGLVNGQMLKLQTDAPEGQLLYQVPANIDEGTQMFVLSSDAGGAASEAIVIEKDTNPLWYNTIMGVPLTEWFLLLLVVISFAMYASLRTKMKRIESHEPHHEVIAAKIEPRAARPKPARAQPQHVVRSQAMSVACEFCGQNIEITTSRRPIEVMCPSCGETQIVKR